MSSYLPWRVCLFKRGMHVLVNTNFTNADGTPPEWLSATLVGVAQYGRLCRVRYDDGGQADHPRAGSTETVCAFRVQRALALPR